MASRPVHSSSAKLVGVAHAAGRADADADDRDRLARGRLRVSARRARSSRISSSARLVGRQFGVGHGVSRAGSWIRGSPSSASSCASASASAKRGHLGVRRRCIGCAVGADELQPMRIRLDGRARRATGDRTATSPAAAAPIERVSALRSSTAISESSPTSFSGVLRLDGVAPRSRPSTCQRLLGDVRLHARRDAGSPGSARHCATIDAVCDAVAGQR